MQLSSKVKTLVIAALIWVLTDLFIYSTELMYNVKTEVFYFISSYREFTKIT